MATTPKQRHSANAARKIIQASKYAEQFKKDPEATIEDVLVDMLHLAATNRHLTQTPEEIVQSVFNHLEAESGPEGDVAGPKEGQLITLLGVPIVGRVDQLEGVANISGMTFVDEEKGFEPQFTGDTDVDWDSQEPIVESGQEIFVDDNNVRWPRDQVLWISDELPERLGRINPIHLEQFLLLHPGLVVVMKCCLHVKDKPTTLNHVLIALQARKTTPTFKKFYQNLKKAVWSYRYRRGL